MTLQMDFRHFFEGCQLLFAQMTGWNSQVLKPSSGWPLRVSVDPLMSHHPAPQWVEAERCMFETSPRNVRSETPQIHRNSSKHPTLQYLRSSFFEPTYGNISGISLSLLWVCTSRHTVDGCEITSWKQWFIPPFWRVSTIPFGGAGFRNHPQDFRSPGIYSLRCHAVRKTSWVIGIIGLSGNMVYHGMV